MRPLIADFIRTNLPLTTAPFLPEIRIYKAAPTSGLRQLADRDRHFTTPYWAYHWGGGLALARYILDNPGIVSGKRVVDLGTGSGVVAIAAALSGAAEILAVDIDPYALVAATLNAEANNVSIVTHLGDLTVGSSQSSFDTILVGDLFYEQATAQRVLALLRHHHDRGCDILIGDPWRASLPTGELIEIASCRVSEASGAQSDEAKLSSIFRLKGLAC